MRFKQWLHTDPLPKSFQKSFWYNNINKDTLQHSTSLNNALKILKDQVIKGKDYVSFWRGFGADLGDISNSGATIVFNGPMLRKLVMPVHYDEKWFKKNPSHGHYIAGPGGEYWGDQALEPVDNFMYKSGENEWISKSDGWLKFPKKSVVAFLTEPYDELRQELDALGYPHVQIEED